MYRKKQLLWPYTILPSVNQINVFMKTKYMLWRTFDRFAFWRTTISMQSCVQVLGTYLHQRYDAVWSTLIRWEFILFQSFDDPWRILLIKQGTSIYTFTTAQQHKNLHASISTPSYRNPVSAIRIVTHSCIPFGFATLSRSRWKSVDVVGGSCPMEVAKQIHQIESPGRNCHTWPCHIGWVVPRH